MARSRSSFELTSAIATASTLAQTEKKPRRPADELSQLRGAQLVSFQASEAPVAVPAPPASRPGAAADAFDDDLDDDELAGAATVAAPGGPESRPGPDSARETGGALGARPGTPAPPAAAARQSTPALAIPPPPPASAADSEALDDDRPRPPKLPDLTNVVSPILRCEKILEWVTEATGGSGVFIADADGLPVAGDIQDAEARIGASGLVASSIATLLQALPGQPSPLFEVHIGEGPYFQLIGFQAAKGTYVVGLTRAAALSPRQAHAIRLACRYAFGEPLTGGGRA